MRKQPKKLAVRKTKMIQKQFMIVLKKNYGLVYQSVDELEGMSYWYYNKWMKEDEDFLSRVKEIQEQTLDWVELQLMKKMNEGSLGAIEFYLKCKGHHRGWKDKREIKNEIQTIEPIEISYIIPEEVKELPEGDKD